MGTSATWLVVRPTDRNKALTILATEGFTPDGAVADPSWILAESQATRSWGDLDMAVDRIGVSIAGPVLAAWDYDSDIGYVVAGDPSGIRARVVVAEWMARAEGLAIPGYTRRTAVADLLSWCADNAPATPTETAIHSVLRGHHIFVEDAIEEILDLCGLGTVYGEPDSASPAGSGMSAPDPAQGPAPDPSFEGYIGPFRGAVPDRLIGAFGWLTDDRRRFAIGMGRSFIGIWDRSRTGPPVEVFPRTVRGGMIGFETLERLLKPEFLHELDVGTLAGFDEVIDIEPETWLNSWTVRWRDARYVAGRGRGFVGVWDREDPGAPVSTYPDDRAGRSNARRRARRLVLEAIMKATRLVPDRLLVIGPDEWRRPGRHRRLLLADCEPDGAPAWAPCEWNIFDVAGSRGAPTVYPFDTGSFDRTRRMMGWHGPAWHDITVPEEVPTDLYATAAWALGVTA